MKYGHNPKEVPPKRRLKTKPLLILIGILFAFNVLWFIGWLIPDKPKNSDEVVATVAGEPIMREEWLTAMEEEVGRETLLDLVNGRVMEAAAKRYGIKVTDQEIDTELALIASVGGQSYSGLDAEKMRQKVRSNLILEKVLTNDVIIHDQEIEDYYDTNTSLYHIETSYRTSMIVLPSKEEAEQAAEELADGSNFAVLAKERSIDAASASLGGDVGYINDSTNAIDQAIVEAAVGGKVGKPSDVIQLKDGTYAIVLVNEVVEGRSFKLNEVKDQIKRELALEQLSQSVSPEMFWKEFDAEWFYGK
ncbi:peptidylprolyl isomerase [Bacillus sp. OxB-1]|uniref:peptidyl-prolyl cis-trans isomerase n=1 Tax=Bacillus sp. (strain OxB-1) TaxID=98228 RepID=UPI0005822D05|nr:peptidyl-prolyl cis-trans isomerase [Bacillus sp. OxB-1]BAQ09517.1 peptidylprolyl isomerase [Bacillus sp. OxB-1]